MQLTEKIKTPIIVQNPLTNKEVNVAPLLDTIDQLSDDTGTYEELRNRIQTIQRLLILATENDTLCGMDHKQAIRDVWMLEDMFSLIRGCKR